MTDIRWQTSFKNLSNALDRLGELMDKELDETDYLLDAITQRFEFCVELFWKTLKHFLALKGKTTYLPKESLQEAYSAGWIDDEQTWLDMMKDRNLTSHTYKHENAIEVYKHVKLYYPEMRKVYNKLKTDVVPKL